MNKYTFMGNGRNKDFYFTFSFFSKGDIVVKINDVIATGYGVFCIPGSGNNDFPFTGGHIHFATAPKSTDIVTIERKLQLNRIIDYQPTASLTPTTVNQDMNYFFELLKDIRNDLQGFQETYAEFTDTESAQTLLERINAAMEEIDTVSGQIEAMGDITTIRTSLTNLGTSVTNLTESLNTLSSTVGGHTTTIGDHTTSIGNIQTSLSGIKISPDYANGESKAWNTEYTATKPGLLVFCAWCNGNGSGVYAIVNGATLYISADNKPMGPGWTGGDHQAYFGGNLPIGAGDTYKLCGGSGYQKLTFFPYK